MQELTNDTPSRDGEHHQSVMMHHFLKHLHPSSGPLTLALYVPDDEGHTRLSRTAVREHRWLMQLHVNSGHKVVHSGTSFFRWVK